MRIILFNRFYWPDASATSQLLTDLAVELARRGHAVTVVAGRRRLDGSGAALPAREIERQVEIRRLPTTALGRRNLVLRAFDYLTYYAGAVAFALFAVRRGDVVVAKTDPPLLGAVLAPALWLKGALLVNWLQDLYPEVAEQLGVMRADSPVARLLRALRNRSLRAARCNVVIGERMRERVAATAPATTVQVIPNWSESLAFTSVPAAGNPYRQQLKLQGKVVFGYSGNLGRAHRFEALLTAGLQLRNRQDVHFLVIGDGPQLARVRQGTRAFPNWSFLPPQPRAALSESLGAADVHLVSLEPKLEGLIVPSKIYGVLAAGRACIFIGAPDGEVANILRTHQCGLTVAPDDAVGLTLAISRLAADSAMRQRLGANARQAAERHFSFGQAAARWDQVCRSM